MLCFIHNQKVIPFDKEATISATKTAMPFSFPSFFLWQENNLLFEKVMPVYPEAIIDEIKGKKNICL